MYIFGPVANAPRHMSYSSTVARATRPASSRTYRAFPLGHRVRLPPAPLRALRQRPDPISFFAPRLCTLRALVRRQRRVRWPLCAADPARRRHYRCTHPVLAGFLPQGAGYAVPQRYSWAAGDAGREVACDAQLEEGRTGEGGPRRRGRLWCIRLCCSLVPSFPCMTTVLFRGTFATADQKEGACVVLLAQAFLCSLLMLASRYGGFCGETKAQLYQLVKRAFVLISTVVWQFGHTKLGVR